MTPEEKQLRELQYAIDEASIVAVTDARGVITYVNSKFCELSKYSQEELIGETHKIINSGYHDKAFFSDLWSTISSGKVWKGEIKNRAKDGSYYWVDSTIVPFLDQNGKPNRYYSIRIDITQRVLADEKFRKEKEEKIHMQKLESLGTLAGGIAHDFNNILQGLSMGLSNIAKNSQDKVLTNTVEDMANLTVRGKELVRQILAFSRKKPHKQESVDLVVLLKELFSMMNSTLPPQVKVRLSPLSDAAYVVGESTQLLQVFINLCTNAAYVLKEKGGDIQISLETDLDIEALPAQFKEAGGEYLKVRVQDSGPGIFGPLRERIFEPFFTTKPIGEGTGMGLSVVHGIVKNHGGDIVLLPYKKGEGAIFDVFIPVGKTDKQDLLSKSHETAPEVAKATECNRILLVDDDLMIEKFGKQLLEDLGYQVETADSAIKGLEILSSATVKFDLIVTDLSMPAMSGIDFAKELLRRGERAPVILATGNLEIGREELSDFHSVGISEIMEKPYTAMELQKTISRIFHK